MNGSSNPVRMRGVAAALVAVALVAAASPTALADEGASYDYTFEWRERAKHVSGLEEFTEEGNTTERSFRIEDANLTVVRVLLTWDDKVGEDDTLSLAVRAPDGSMHGPKNQTGASGAVEIKVRLTETPPGTVSLRAANDNDAWREFLAQYPGEGHGIGDWTVFVTVEDAGDEPGLLASKEDPGQEWHVSVDSASYHGVVASVAEVPPEEDDPEPDPAPTEMPPPDDDPGEQFAGADDEPEESSSDEEGGVAGLISSPGLKSVLLVLAAAIGVGLALALAGRRD